MPLAPLSLRFQRQGALCQKLGAQTHRRKGYSHEYGESDTPLTPNYAHIYVNNKEAEALGFEDAK